MMMTIIFICSRVSLQVRMINSYLTSF